MSDVVLAAIIGAVPPTLIALGAWRSANKANLASRDNGGKIEEVHLSINSRMDQLLEQTRSSAGLQATADEKDRVKREGTP